MVAFGDARTLAERVYSDVSRKNVTFMAAGLAYDAFVSLAPLLLLLVLVLSLVGGGLEERIVAVAANWLPGPIADVVAGIFRADSAGGGASFVGLVVLVWGALKIFRGLDTAFSEIYETDAEDGFADTMTDALVVLVALVVAVVATVATGAAFAVFAGAVPYAGLLTPLVLLVGLAVAFFPVYYVFPDADVEVREVLPGVVVAAVGWAAFQALFQVYLAFSDPGAGSFFGGVIVVVTYLYFSALVLLVGAVVNAVVGGHSTGAPGGVGREAGRSTVRESSLDREELAAYLADLRGALTGRYQRMGARAGAHPRPAGDVEVVERSSREDGTRRWTVTLRWDADGAGGPEESGD